MNRGLVFFLLFIALGGIAIWGIAHKSKTPGQVINPTIEEYVQTHISNLSPEKEVLGGRFYVTSVEAHGGAGTVEYEDGHNAYTADFRYVVDQSGAPQVTSFTIRP